MSAQPAVNRDAFADARENYGAIETFLGSNGHSRWRLHGRARTDARGCAGVSGAE